MKRIGIAGFATLLVVVASLLAVVGTASAALPEALPKPTEELNWTGKNVGSAVLSTANGSTITCPEAKGDGTLKAATPLGAFHIHFEKCLGESLGIKAKCNTTGDAEGIVLVLGEYHVVDESLTTLDLGLLFLFEKLHIQCTALLLFLIEGNVLCLILAFETSAASHEFHCSVTGNGKPAKETYFNDEGKETKIKQLLSNTNGGTNEAAAESALGTVVFASAISFMG